MLKSMIFIDFENFNITKNSYYQQMNSYVPKIDFNLFPQKLLSKIPIDLQLVKTFIFAPKPDDFLMKDSRKANKYYWLKSLNNYNFLSVIEGSHIARPAHGLSNLDMDITNPDTFYVIEKGSDVNLATHVLTKGFMNAYDVAVIVSGDMDYIPVINTLNTIGKSVVIVGIEGQNLSKFTNITDFQVYLNDDFFDKCSIEQSVSI